MQSADLQRPFGAAGDTGGIVLGWLTRLTVLLAVLGLIAFDAISIVTSRLSLEDVGNQAARNASETWQRTHDIRASLLSAQTTASDADAGTSVVTNSLRIDPDGTAHLTVTREAATLVAHYLPSVRNWCDQRVDGQGRSTA